MTDLISTLADKSGISADMAKKGLSALLAFFKANLPGESFAKLRSAIPGAESMLAEHPEAQEPASGGILDAVKGMAGKIFGGAASGAGAVLGKFTQLGFSMEQIQKFLPNVLAYLKSKVPGDVMKQVSGLLPSAGGSES
jgi:hypothetical protein